MKKIISIILISLLICCCISVQIKYFENKSNFKIKNNDTIFKFKISNLDNSPLINSTFLGGNDNDGDFYTGANIFQDNNGNIFIAGTTESLDFPITNNVYSNIISGDKDVFITKFDNNLSKVLASTYIGGSSNDEARGLYIDDNGNIYVSGITESNDFPVTDNAYQPNFHGGTEGPYGNGDSFLIKLDNNLTFLLGSTYLGGSGHECCSSVILDNNDFVFISGSTSSVDFPITENAFDSIYNPNGYFGEDVYVSKFSNDLSALISSTFLGGNGDDFSESIKTDQFGNLFISGWTSSTNFPTSVDAFDRIFGGGYYDGFITKLNSDLSNLEESTYLGGRDWDFCYDMTLDEDNNVYVTGHTASTDFPTTPNSFCEEYQGSSGANEGDDVFISRFMDDLTDLTASTFFGGSRWENGISIIVRGNRVFITGTTSSYDFPISNNAFITEFQGGIRNKGDLFISTININLDDLYTSTYLGSNRNEAWGQIIIDDEEKIIVTGSTSSTDFPVTINCYDANHNGGYDIFISRFQKDLSYQQPPIKPNKPNGISNGKTGEEYEYITSTSDPENDDIYYLFDWGDNTITDWIGPFLSGETAIIAHVWDEVGDYNIKVKAKDEFGAESEWSDPLIISMSKSKNFVSYEQLIERLIEKFPIIERLLNTY
jgi:hypothetical protein